MCLGQPANKAFRRNRRVRRVAGRISDDPELDRQRDQTPKADPGGPSGCSPVRPGGGLATGRWLNSRLHPGCGATGVEPLAPCGPHATWVLHTDRPVRVATAGVSGHHAGAPRKPLDPGVRPPTRVHRALHPRWCREMSGRLSGTHLNCVLPTDLDPRELMGLEGASKRFPGLSWRRQRQRSSDAVPTCPAFHTLAFVRRFGGCAPV